MIEPALLAAIDAKPSLRGLTLWATAQGWQANASTDGKSWRVAVSADPTAALIEALNGPRAAPPETSKSVFD